MKKLSSALGFALSLGLFSVAVPSVHAAEMFNSQSPWMLGDWNGKRTALQQQGYDFSFSYTGEMATLLDAKSASDHGTEYADQFAVGAHFDLNNLSSMKYFSFLASFGKLAYLDLSNKPL